MKENLSFVGTPGINFTAEDLAKIKENKKECEKKMFEKEFFDKLFLLTCKSRKIKELIWNGEHYFELSEESADC